MESLIDLSVELVVIFGFEYYMAFGSSVLERTPVVYRRESITARERYHPEEHSLCCHRHKCKHQERQHQAPQKTNGHTETHAFPKGQTPRPTDSIAYDKPGEYSGNAVFN
jgi:hypothetical protein